MDFKLSRGARGILGAALLAVAGFSIPAHAGDEPAPVLRSMSLVNGWSSLSNIVAANYNVALVRTGSSVVVVDKRSANVDGVTTLAKDDKRILVFTSDDPLLETKAPYTVTFSAKAIDQDPLIANTVDTASFKIDAFAPKSPTIKNTDDKRIVLPSETVKFEGVAKDTGLSGVKSVELHFYNPAANATVPTPDDLVNRRIRIGDEVIAYRMTQTISCSGGICPDTANYSFTVGGLPTGLWTIKAAAVDLAGNRSGETQADLPILVIKGA